MRYALGISYIGTNYIGYQSQNKGNSIQEEVSLAIAKVADHPVSIMCAGRTDKGVHALLQVIHFDSDANRENHQWIRGINASLPKDISALWIKPVEETFHARFSATSRGYVYLLNTQKQDLMMSNYAWEVGDLDIDLMKEAASHLLGERDFYAFQSRFCQAKHSFRCVQEVKIERVGKMIYFHIKANAFLHHMVRKIVATMVKVGEGKLALGDFIRILEEKDRASVPGQAPAKGLFLKQVVYSDTWDIPSKGESQLLGALYV